MATQRFDVTGMTCAACSARVEQATSGVPGVENAVVNLLKNSMDVTYDGAPETIAAISVAVDKDPRACYFKQVLYGKYMRMALMLKLLEV